MREHHTSILIHGHTHRPKVHDLNIDGTPAQRFVLAEWTQSGSVLCWQNNGCWAVETV
jgi:UDP-2,3-diacylglucosamine hydrolase